MKTAAVVFVIAFGIISAALAQREDAILKDYVKANVSAPPAELNLDPFYEKYTDALGIAVVASEKVPDAALLVTRDIVIHMLSKRPDIHDAMVAGHQRVAIMAVSEMTTDIPEHRNLKKPAPGAFSLTAAEKSNYENGIGKMTDKDYWDRRARGLGGRPLTTCAEENLLGYPGTRYYGENIFVHEFSHAIHATIRQVDPKLWDGIQAAYKDAMAKGLWKGQYGETNWNEYFAEATQTWFWSNFEFRGAPRARR